jgi:hypothetical protein
VRSAFFFAAISLSKKLFCLQKFFEYWQVAGYVNMYQSLTSQGFYKKKLIILKIWVRPRSQWSPLRIHPWYLVKLSLLNRLFRPERTWFSDIKIGFVYLESKKITFKIYLWYKFEFVVIYRVAHKYLNDFMRLFWGHWVT